MQIYVKVRPRAKVEKVEKIDDENFVVWVNEPADKGKANEAVLKSLADYFDLPKWKLSIISGHTTRQKVIEIM